MNRRMEIAAEVWFWVDPKVTDVLLMNGGDILYLAYWMRQ